jgi:hypothetical protein
LITKSTGISRYTFIFEHMLTYQINIKTIIGLMNSNFGQFNREFLHNDFYYIVKYHLEEKNTLATVPFTEENRDYLNSYKDRYKQDRLKSIDYANYPFPDYYLKEKKINNEYVFEIVELNSDCPVEKEDTNFDLFFAYQLALINIMEIDIFLDFHLVETFENNFTSFENFILKIIQKYKEILQDKRSPLIEHFLKNNKTMQSTMDLPEKNNKEFTTARQVLAIHYLLKEIDEDNYRNIDKTEIARFIQFLTGRETGAKVITNTNIYKKITSLYSKNDKTLEDDLQFVRNFFEKIGLQNIANQLSTEISKKE